MKKVNMENNLYILIQCVKDGRIYASGQIHNFDDAADYDMISCFPVNEEGDIEIRKEVQIYRKDLFLMPLKHVG
ncbi:MAG: hypothetical protein ACJ75J_10410 [Cytophagaceae bacterium]